MKKIISKILIIFIVAILLTEFSFSNISNAAQGLDSKTLNLISNLIGGVISIVFWIPKLFTTAILWSVTNIITNDIASIGSGSTTVDVVTPFNVFFNKYKVLDINFFKMDTGYGVLTDLRKNVATWFYFVRTISAAILLVVLIYIGIRMALSTVASDKARYKKMFFDWACSLVLIFVIQYLAIFIIYCNEAIVKLIEGLINGSDTLGSAVEHILLESLIGVGISGMMATLVYIMLAIQTLFFMIAYLNRVLKIAFLIIISPLIAITYSIDKIGDGKAQALNTWLKEFVYTILIQPFDCIMYIAFVNAAASLLVSSNAGILGVLGLSPEVNEIVNGALAVLCLKFINDGEKIVRKIFNFSDDNESTSMAAGTALAVMALQRAQKAKGYGTKMFGKDSAFGKKVTNDIDKIKGTKIGQKATDITNKIGQSDLVKGLTDTYNNSKLKTGVDRFRKTITGVNKNKNQFFKSHKRIASLANKTPALALGGLTAAMMYAGGESGALESAIAGKRVYNMSEQRFATTMNNMLNNVDDDNDREDERDYEKLDEKIGETTQELAKEGLSEDEMDDTDKLNEDANADDEAARKVQEEVAKERRQAKIDELNQSIANREAMFAARPEAITGKYLEDYRKMVEERDRLLEDEITQEELDAANDDERVARAHQKAAKSRAISNKANERSRLKNAKAEFYTEEASKERIKKRRRKISEAELTAKLNEIMAIILMGNTANKGKNRDDADTSMENNFTDSEFDSAERTTYKLADTIQHAIQSGSDFDVRDYLTKHMGISSFDNKNSLGYALAREVDNYKSLVRRNKIAKGFETAEAIGVKPDKFAESLAARTSRYREIDKGTEKRDNNG